MTPREIFDTLVTMKRLTKNNKLRRLQLFRKWLSENKNLYSQSQTNRGIVSLMRKFAGIEYNAEKLNDFYGLPKEYQRNTIQKLCYRDAEIWTLYGQKRYEFKVEDALQVLDYLIVNHLQSKKGKALKEIRHNRDYHLFYCKKHRRNYLLLGYFYDNIAKKYEYAKRFCEITGYSIEDIYFAEITKSSRYCRFDYLWSSESEQLPLPDSYIVDNVYESIR